tara:strand:- start:711 stop:989 length:279 start_codon:yes stop_codon:yes gene_type:complete
MRQAEHQEAHTLSKYGSPLSSSEWETTFGVSKELELKLGIVLPTRGEGTSLGSKVSPMARKISINPKSEIGMSAIFFILLVGCSDELEPLKT